MASRAARAARLVNFITLLALGFAGLTVMTYMEKQYNLSSFYLLMAGALLLGQVGHLAPGNRGARLAADAGIVLLSLNVIHHYGYRDLSMYNMIAFIVLAAALGEALYVAERTKPSP